ncbi:MAG TPA: type II secretion system F family protein [Acidimicrobiales bacterium]|nr:type II secretion system F family protein [Acidimicrobiales bacterium]
MAVKFKYAALSVDGNKVSGVMEADSAKEVEAALASDGLQATEVKAKRGLLSFELTTKKVPRKELMHFSRQLSVFVRAGIPIVDALTVIAEETPNKVFKQTLLAMASDLRMGSTFYGAALSHPEAFPAFYLSILRSAELTGALDTVLDQLADYIERDLEARRKITQALVYPIIVLVMSIIAVCVITIFVLPRFETFFNSLNAKLPLATRILINITHALTTWWFIFAAVGGLIVVAIALGATTKSGKEIRDELILKVPVLKDLVRNAVLERFCRILSSMNRAGVPLPDALAVTSEGTNNYVYKKGLVPAREAMMRGEGLARPLSATGLFPPAARQMLRVGEDTGTLDEQLETAAVYFDRELDYQLKRFTNLFEPAVIIVMGLVVGFVAIALVSALYGIFRQVHV